MENQNILQRAQVKGTTQTIKSYAGIDGQLLVNKTTGDLHIMSGVAGSNKVLPCRQTVSQMIQSEAPAPDLSPYLTKTEASSTYLGKTQKAVAASTADRANAVAWNNVSGKPRTFPPSAHKHVKRQITDFAHVHTISEITNLQTTLDGKLGKTQKAVAASTADRANAVAWDNVSGKPPIPATPRIYVVETWGSTNSKYRVWSDGFIEQWGLYYPQGEYDRTVSFPRPFSNTNYTFLGAPNENGQLVQPFAIGTRNKTTSSIYFTITGVANSMWYAAGY